MSPTSPPLADAIAALYSTFSRYRADDLSCCDFPDDLPLNLRLRSARLEQLSPSDLHLYAWKAMTTWGTVGNFKHFLPRLFELLAQDGHIDQDDPEVLLGKLAYGHWQTWPARERAAVEGYLWALWRHLRQTHPYDLSADRFLGGIGNCVDDLMPWLADWETDPDASFASALHLAEFVESNIRHALSGKQLRRHPVNPFLERGSRTSQQLWTWLTAPARLARLEAAFFRHGPADSDEVVAEAVSLLEIYNTVVTATGTPPGAAP